MEKRTILQRFMEWTRLGKRKAADDPSQGSRLAVDEGIARLDRAKAAKQAKVAQCGRPAQAVAAVGLGAEIAPAALDAAKLTMREETILRIREGFKDLSNILGSINTNIEDQAKTSRNLDVKMDVFPSILDEAKRSSEKQCELVETFSKGMSETELRQKEALKSLRALPVALAAIQENELASYKVLAQIRDDLSKRAGVEQEMSKSFRSLDDTLKQVGKSAQAQTEQLGSMEKAQKAMAIDFSKNQKEAVESFQISQDLALNSFGKSQNELLASFQKAQDGLRKRMLIAVCALGGAFLLVLAAGAALAAGAISDLGDSHKAVARAAIGQQTSIKDDISRVKEENQRLAAKLNAALKAKQQEMDILMNASKAEMDRLGEEHGRILAEKKREIAELKQKAGAAADGR